MKALYFGLFSARHFSNHCGIAGGFHPEIYLRPFPDGARQWPVSIGGGSNPLWSPNGREIFYRTDDEVMAVEVHFDQGSPRLGSPRVLFERPVSGFWGGQNYDVAPDGQSFVIVERVGFASVPDQLILVQNFHEELKRLVPAAR